MMRNPDLGWPPSSAIQDLRNPDDDYSISVFDPAVRGKSDRFVHLYEKPAL